MAEGHYRGLAVHAPEIRALFTRENLLASDWYRQRLQVKRERDLALWTRNLNELVHFKQNRRNVEESRRLDIDARIDYAQSHLDALAEPESWREFIGTLGADPLAPVAESLAA
jgi:hypothetical protein